MEFSLILVSDTDAELQLIKRACQNVFPGAMTVAVLQFPIDSCPGIAEITIDSNAAGYDSRVPKLFHLPTNFGTIAYQILTYSN